MVAEQIAHIDYLDIVADAQRVQQLGRIADAARTYRELMGQYMTEQAARAARGSTLDELVSGNFGLFEKVTAAEDALFAAVDAAGVRRARSSATPRRG